MSNIRAIRSEADYEAAIARIDDLMDAEGGTPEGEELDVLTDLVELYEAKHVPMGLPSPLGAIRFRMEQGGLSPRDLIPFMGSRAKVSEVLSGKRPLTMQMARALHANLGVPADVLLQQPGGELHSALEGTEWHRFPLAEMAKRGWIENNHVEFFTFARQPRQYRQYVVDNEPMIDRGQAVEGEILAPSLQGFFGQIDIQGTGPGTRRTHRKRAGIGKAVQ